MSKVIGFKQSLDHYLRLCDERTADGDYLGALDAARNALTHAKTRMDRKGINMLLGQIYFEMGLYSLSCEHFFRVVALPQLRAGAFFGIGRNLVMLKRYNDALEYFEAVLNFDYADVFTEAVTEWLNTIKISLSHQESRQHLQDALLSSARGLIKLRDYDNAIQILSPLCDDDEFEPDALSLRADAYFWAGEINSSRADAIRLLRTFPDHVGGLIRLVHICLELGDDFNVETNLDRLLRLECANFKDNYLIALTLCDLRDYPRAVEYFNKVLAQKEYAPNIWLFAAITAYNAGRNEDAMYYVSRAKWLDYENPIFNIYYEIFRRELVRPPLKLLTQIPLDLAESKLHTLRDDLNNPNFCDALTRSLTLADDIEWGMTLNDPELTELAGEKLAKCQKNLAQKLFHKLMLSVRPTREQKFIFVKNALLHGHIKTLDVTADLKFRSIRVRFPAPANSNPKLKNSAACARAYAECFASLNVCDSIRRVCSGLDAQTLNGLDEPTITCLMLSQNIRTLEQACAFFGADIRRVLEIKSYNKL